MGPNSTWQETLVARSQKRSCGLLESEEANKDLTDARFCELMEESKGREERSHGSFEVIPRFWASSKRVDKKAEEEGNVCVKKGRRVRGDLSLIALARCAAESRFEREAGVLTWEELEELRMLLLKSREERLNYEVLCLRRREVKSRDATRALSARRFLEAPRDARGRASARDLYEGVDRATCAAKTRTALRRYARSPGLLFEADLERYVSDLIPDMPATRGVMDEKFQPFYVFTAVRRFMFFLDPRRRGYLRVDDAAASRVALDLLEIFADDDDPKKTTAAQTPHAPSGDKTSPPGPPLGPHHSSHTTMMLNKSWFFPETAKRVYADYLELDVDHNGMLSKAEFLNFRGPRGEARLTQSFVDRVFAEIMTYPTETPPCSGHFEPEMDFKTYLDVVFAFEHVDATQGLQYFWRILDVQKNNRLTVFGINFFFRDVASRLKDLGFDPPSTADVVDEIFDIVKPQNPTHITFDDLTRSKQAHTVILVLVDVNGFLAYDNREHLMHPNFDDDDF